MSTGPDANDSTTPEAAPAPAPAPEPAAAPAPLPPVAPAPQPSAGPAPLPPVTASADPTPYGPYGPPPAAPQLDPSQAAAAYGQPSAPAPAPAPAPSPAPAAPQYGQPQYGQPQYGQPQYGQPQYGQPQYGQAPAAAPQYGQPATGQPAGAPDAGQAYAGQPAGAPYAGQQYAGQPYAGQPYAGQQDPGQPYPAQPYPAQPGGPGGTQPPAGEQPRKRKPAVVAAVVAGSLVAVAALGAGGVWAYGKFFGGSGAAAYDNPVTDIAEKPDTAWSWKLDADDDIADYVSLTSTRGAGDSGVVVATSFDYYSWFSDGDYDTGWYEGYDEQYAEGYAGGTSYADAYDAYDDAVDAWYADTTGTVDYPDYPDYNDYLPNGLSEDELYESSNAGYYDGFMDGMDREQEGASKLQAPPTVDFAAQVVMLDAADGSVRWTHDVTEDIDTDDPADLLPYVHAADDATVVFEVSTMDDEGTTTTELVTLDAGDGSVLGSVEVDGSVVDAVVVDGTTVVTTVGVDDYSVAAYKDGDEVWSESADGYSMLCEFSEGVVAVASYASAGAAGCSVDGVTDFYTVADGSSALDLDTGDGIGYSPYGDGYLKADGTISDETGEIEDGSVMLVDAQGNDLWDDALDIDDESYAFVKDGLLFRVFDYDGGEGELQRLNAGDGSDLWDDSVTVSDFLGVQGGYVLVVSDGDLRWLELGSGEEAAKDGVDDDGYYGLVGQGDNAYVFGGGDLVAYAPADAKPLWTYGIDDDAVVTRVGSSFYVVSDAEVALLK
jgi:hypothetical protein